MNVSISARSMLDTKAEAIMLVHGAEDLPLEYEIDSAVAERWPEPHGEFLKKVGRKRFGYKRGGLYFIHGDKCPSLLFVRIKEGNFVGTMRGACEKMGFEEIKSVSLPPFNQWDLIETIRVLDSLDCFHDLTMHFDLGKFYDEKMAQTIERERSYRIMTPGPANQRYASRGLTQQIIEEMHENIETRTLADLNRDLAQAVERFAITENGMQQLPRREGARANTIIIDDMEDDETQPVRAVEPTSPPRSINNILERWWGQYHFPPPHAPQPTNTQQQAHDIFEQLINPDQLPYKVRRGELTAFHIMRVPECTFTHCLALPPPTHEYVTMTAPRNMTENEVHEWAASLALDDEGRLVSILSPWAVSRDRCPHPKWYRYIAGELYRCAGGLMPIASIAYAIMMAELGRLLKPLTEAAIQSTDFISRTDAHTIIGMLEEERLWRNDPEEILQQLVIPPIVSYIMRHAQHSPILLRGITTFTWLQKIVATIHFYLINYNMAHDTHRIVTEALYEAERSPLP